jgi:predicted metallo-beta-lactamase superfamily hydrolase
MTREDGRKLWSTGCGVDIVDKIYDHFEPLEKMYNILKQQKEDLIEGQEILIKAHERTIEDYMNRTCESCRHFQNKINEEEITCNYHCGFYPIKYKHCGCWESKE